MEGIKFIIFIISAILNAWLNVKIIRTKMYFNFHIQQALLLSVLFTALYFKFTIHEILIGVVIYWILFDLILNWLVGYDLLYVGNTSKIDILMNKIYFVFCKFFELTPSEDKNILAFCIKLLIFFILLI